MSGIAVEQEKLPESASRSTLAYHMKWFLFNNSRMIAPANLLSCFSPKLQSTIRRNCCIRFDNILYTGVDFRIESQSTAELHPLSSPLAIFFCNHRAVVLCPKHTHTQRVIWDYITLGNNIKFESCCVNVDKYINLNNGRHCRHRLGQLSNIKVTKVNCL